MLHKGSKKSGALVLAIGAVVVGAAFACALRIAYPPGLLDRLSTYAAGSSAPDPRRLWNLLLLRHMTPEEMRLSKGWVGEFIASDLPALRNAHIFLRSLDTVTRSRTGFSLELHLKSSVCIRPSEVLAHFPDAMNPFKNQHNAPASPERLFVTRNLSPTTSPSLSSSQYALYFFFTSGCIEQINVAHSTGYSEPLR